MSENANNVIVMAQENKSKKKSFKKAGIITTAVLALGAAAYGAYKHFTKQEEEDFDFDESFEDDDTLATREYVNVTPVETTEE